MDQRMVPTGAADAAPARPGRFRRALQRLTAENEELEARDLQDAAESVGATALARCPLREPVQVAGTVRSVMIRPRGGVPTLEAELYDGTGSVTLVWLGRRRITGIDTGRSLVVRGRMTDTDGQRLIFNPDYELRVTESAD